MILFFHLVCLFARYIAVNISKSLSIGKVISDDEDENDAGKSDFPDFMQGKGYTKQPVYKDGTLKFFPPVYVQRYEAVALLLRDPAWKDKIRKVVDFGCAELGFFMYLKNAENVTEILEVDTDSELLERCAHKTAPLTCDYLMGKNKKPLDVYVLAGSVGDFDDILIGCDAVVCIELIEHLTEETFKKMPHNIFHKIRPKLAIFTTPNADFNSLFPNFKGLRNDDHKFEWTRKEFFNWTQEIIKLYPEYSTRFYGIGTGPEGTENLGCCSQMAVFQRSDAECFSTARDRSEGVYNYKLIKHYNYPVYEDKRTTEEKIIQEIQYQARYFNTSSVYYNYENNESEIPLTLLKEYVADLCNDDEELRNILIKNGMILRKKNNSWCLVYEETDSGDQNFEDDQCLDEEMVDEGNVKDNGELNPVERKSSEQELCLKSFRNVPSARSLEELETQVVEHMEKNIFTNTKKKGVFLKKDKVISAPHSCNSLPREPGKMVHIDYKHSVRNSNNSDFWDDEGDRLNLGRSRIPRKRKQSKEKCSAERSSGKASLSPKSRSSHCDY